ncbi:MAG: (E)-4-hydroxy-3-methylbut-2-enyl-diphosphate synthase [Candidatus Moranbacteria bacterium]|nr:(E)-4-hydroxy-3-methylbut-2-enyl-diphosphate synthase [Candidatus Moranbacteria bacterium]
MKNNFSALKSRRKTRVVKVGNINIGGDNPVRVQTMTNTDTLDIEATVEQILKCVKAGSELIRLTTQTPAHVKALGEIRKILQEKHNCDIPLIADTHFNLDSAYEAINWADKIRINPGLFANKFAGKKSFTDEEYQQALNDIEETLIPFIEKLKEKNVPLRIGTNHGSLSPRILERHGNTVEGLVMSVMEYLNIFRKHDYENLVVAIKSSDPLVMLEANRLLAKTLDENDMDYPIHLGVTEAGMEDDGRAKSTIGIGVPLMEGIGDTLRVSLTEEPEKEIPVCYTILQAVQRRITKTEFISCPSCGRTLFNIEKVTKKIKEKLSHLKGLKIAVMGCIVNGPGEMAGADYGYVGGAPDKVSLYYQGELVKRNVPENEAIDELIALIKENGDWVDEVVV